MQLAARPTKNEAMAMLCALSMKRGLVCGLDETAMISSCRQLINRHRCRHGVLRTTEGLSVKEAAEELEWRKNKRKMCEYSRVLQRSMQTTKTAKEKGRKLLSEKYDEKESTMIIVQVGSRRL